MEKNNVSVCKPTDIVETEYLDARQLAQKLKLSKKTIIKWSQAKRIPGQIKVGGIWRYSSIAVEKALISGQFLKGAIYGKKA